VAEAAEGSNCHLYSEAKFEERIFMLINLILNREQGVRFYVGYTLKVEGSLSLYTSIG